MPRPSLTTAAPPIVVPDRFESLVRKAREHLKSIVVEIKSGLEVIDRLHATMEYADRGAFMLLQGVSGAGKSTFLHTVGLYRQGVTSVSVPGDEPIRAFLRSHAPAADQMTILVLEEREAATSFTDSELED